MNSQSVGLRYFYDDTGQLFRALDSTGILIEYIYDPSGNITQINRSTVSPNSLAILNISPLKGLPGATLTIVGQNFSTTPANDVVNINGLAATVVSATATQLVITIPTGATAGQITVTTGGTTATSGSTLVFNPSPVAVITSIYPDGIIAGTTSPNIQVTGTDFLGGTFSFPSGATATATYVGSLTASLQVTALSNRGVFPLVATTAAGTSTTAVTPGNHFIVMISPDEADGTFISVLNTAPPSSGGTDPTDVSNQAISQVVSVLNTLSPAGKGTDPTDVSNQAISQIVSLLNTASPAGGGTDPTDVSNQVISQFVSVLNESLPANGGTDPTDVSNEADSYLVSVLNNGSGSARPNAAPTPTGAVAVATIAEPALNFTNSAGTDPVLAGQLLTLAATPPANTTEVDLSINGAKVQTADRMPYAFVLNVPATPGDLNFVLRSQNALEGVIASSRWQQKVVADTGTQVQGRIVDSAGAPIAGAHVTVEAFGLLAEYFKVDPGFASIPNIETLTPDRTTFEAGLEWLNPGGLFGQDPIGTGLDSYVARYTANLVVPNTGVYAFALSSAGISELKIDGNTVSGTINLAAGSHPLEVLYYKSQEPASLQLLWTPPNSLPAAVPVDALESVDPKLTAASSKAGEFMISNVPARVSQVRVRVVLPDGRIFESVWRKPVAGAVTDLGDTVIPAKQ